MPRASDGPSHQRLLVFNCHESWIAQLGGLGFDLDILVGLPGRFAAGWDTQARPAPHGARLLTLNEVRASRNAYHCIVLHSPADLLAAKALSGARLLVVHNTLEGRMAEESTTIEAARVRGATLDLVRKTGTHAVAISPLKARSWGLDERDVLLPGIDASGFGPYRGSHPAGIRVANHVHLRQQILRWDLHAAAFHRVPLTLVGHNPGVLGSAPARSFQHLKDLLRVHRFYVHTADPQLEDGYNLATLEAMASGLPVVGNRHPTSPVVHGISGLLSDDPSELREFAATLLADAALAARLGAAARDRVTALFSREAFAVRFRAAVTRAVLTNQAWRSSCLVGPGA